jgi:ABC-type nitrate/sulfonate/bicarbonate transport system substrate-binding protein
LKRLLAIALLCALQGCAPNEETKAVTKPAPALTRLTLNVNPTISYAPLMIAKEEGFFAAEGIDAELVSLDSNGALAALVAGKIDVLSTGVRSGVFNMILSGQPIRVVADKGHSSAKCSGEAFVAPAAMAERIAARGLRGERVAIVRGGVAEYLTTRLLESHQLTTAGVVAIPMPQGSHVSAREHIEAVRYTGEPNLSLLLAEGATKIVATAEELAPGHQISLLVYGKKLLRDDPELGRRFMRAYLRGVRQFNAGKTQRNMEIVGRFTKLPPETTRGACWVAIADDGRIDPAAVQPFLDWALAKQYLDGPIEASRWWNPMFIDAVRGVDAVSTQ